MKKMLFLLIVLFVFVCNVGALEPYEVFVKNESIKNEIVDVDMSYIDSFYNIEVVDGKFFSSNSYVNNSSSETILFYGDEVIHGDKVYDFIYPLENGDFVALSFYQVCTGDRIWWCNSNNDLYNLYPTVHLLDSNLVEKKSVRTDFFYSGDYDLCSAILIKDDGVYFLFMSDDFNLENLNAKILKVSKDVTSYENVEVTKELLEANFPSTLYEYIHGLNGKKYALNGEYLVVSEGKTFSLYVDDHVKFTESVENPEFEDFSNVELIENRILVSKKRLIDTSLKKNDETGKTSNLLENPQSYSDSLLVYDMDGNLLQTIFGNSAYLEVKTSDDSKKFMLVSSYTDGVCTTLYSGHLDCPIKLSYEVYEFNPLYDLSGNYIGPEVNPNTTDMALIIISVVMIVSFIFAYKRKRFEF